MQPYLQTTNYTCAASSLLTIIHYFKPEMELSRENEFNIWKNTALLPTRASCIYALANYARLNGLNPKVMVEIKGYTFPDYRFYRYTKEDIDNAKFLSKINLKEAERNNVLIEEKEITLNLLKSEVKNNLLLIRINTRPIRNDKKNSSNYIILHGFSQGYFQIIDPALGALSVPESTLQEAFDTLETKKYRDHRLISFEKKVVRLHSPQKKHKKLFKMDLLPIK